MHFMYSRKYRNNYLHVVILEYRKSFFFILLVKHSPVLCSQNSGFFVASMLSLCNDYMKSLFQVPEILALFVNALLLVLF